MKNLFENAQKNASAEGSMCPGFVSVKFETEFD